MGYVFAGGDLYFTFNIFLSFHDPLLPKNLKPDVKDFNLHLQKIQARINSGRIKIWWWNKADRSNYFNFDDGLDSLWGSSLSLGKFLLSYRFLTHSDLMWYFRHLGDNGNSQFFRSSRLRGQRGSFKLSVKLVYTHIPRHTDIFSHEGMDDFRRGGLLFYCVEDQEARTVVKYIKPRSGAFMASHPVLKVIKR